MAVRHLYVLHHPHGSCIPSAPICCQAMQELLQGPALHLGIREHSRQQDRKNSQPANPLTFCSCALLLGRRLQSIAMLSKRYPFLQP